ncbi:MAG: hypothetical protein ABIF10_04675 [Candidatus Woesearchaeota archaeon]
MIDSLEKIAEDGRTSTFDPGPASEQDRERKTSNTQDWLASDNPVVHIYGDTCVEKRYLQAAKEGVEELFREIGIGASVKIADQKDYLDKLFAEYRAVDELLSARIVVKAIIQDGISHNHLLHADIALTVRGIGGYWGITQGDDPGKSPRKASLVTTSNNTQDTQRVKLVAKHEMTHQIGAEFYSEQNMYNCVKPGCLMTFKIEGDTLCSKCLKQVIQYIEGQERKYNKKILIK